MLPPEPAVLAAREDFADAQALLAGVPSIVGYYTLGWYGTETSDERGSFGLVDPNGPLAGAVGNAVELTVAQGGSVNVYVIGSLANLGTVIAVTRRAYMAVALLADDPVLATVALLS